MVPKPGVNYLQSYIRPNPDLYGPFWICITLVFTTALAGNLSNYLQTPSGFKWKYDFHKVTLATSSIFSYAWLVPLMIWGVLLWRGSKANISLLEMICLYGYSLAIFVPVSLLWMIPLRWLQWCLGIVAAVLSGGVLVRTIQPAISHEARKVALAIGVLILVLHAALALGFMLYFFYPPNTEPAIKQEALPTGKSEVASPQPPENLQNKENQLPNKEAAAAKIKEGGGGGGGGEKGSKQSETKREERAKENLLQGTQFNAETNKEKQDEPVKTSTDVKINDTVNNAKSNLSQTEAKTETSTEMKLQKEKKEIENNKDSLKNISKTKILADQKQSNITQKV